MSEQTCGLCEDPIPPGSLDVHINRFHRMMPDRYHALVGGFAESGRQLAAERARREALEVALAEERERADGMVRQYEDLRRELSKTDQIVCDLSEAGQRMYGAIKRGGHLNEAADAWDRALRGRPADGGEA